MNYEGVAFELYHDDGTPMWEDPPPSVSAILTNKLASIDYREADNTPVHIEAASHDGITYSGEWGYPSLDHRQPVELQAFVNNKNSEIVLIGTWEDHKDARQGVYIFRLWPTQH